MYVEYKQSADGTRRIQKVKQQQQANEQIPRTEMVVGAVVVFFCSNQH